MPDNLHRLQRIKFIEAAGLIEARPIKHGLNNHSFHVITEQGPYFVRFNAVISGVDRQREARALDLISALNLSPSVILNEPNNNVLITDWCRGKRWHSDDFKNNKLVTTLANQLKTFHQINLSQETIFNNSRLDKRLLSYTENQKDSIKEHITRHINKLEQLDFWQANQSLTHFDLNPGNIIGRQPPMLLDWEFAGLGHPLIDWLIIEYECGHSLDNYYHHLDDNNWLPPLRALIQIMMQIWAK
jgi:aminoglycoside phosphotransferase (APT) family kinase protein